MTTSDLEGAGWPGAGDDLDEGIPDGPGGRQAAGAVMRSVDAGAGGALDVGERALKGCAHVGAVTTVNGRRGDGFHPDDSPNVVEPTSMPSW